MKVIRRGCGLWNNNHTVQNFVRKIFISQQQKKLPNTFVIDSFPYMQKHYMIMISSCTKKNWVFSFIFWVPVTYLLWKLVLFLQIIFFLFLFLDLSWMTFVEHIKGTFYMKQKKFCNLQIICSTNNGSKKILFL